jgi:hypothetical protein
LSQASAAEYPCHPTSDENRYALRYYGEESQSNQGESEEVKADSLKEWRERRIRNEAPIQMESIGERLKFIAMKAVSLIGEQMNSRDS